MMLDLRRKIMRGVIVEVRPILKKQKLRILAKVKTPDGGRIQAYLPDREVSAILPRGVLIGEERQVPRELLATIAPIVRRLVGGRSIRLWEYEDTYFFSFLPWQQVRFTSKSRTKPR
jgi:hypothetical protein